MSAAISFSIVADNAPAKVHLICQVLKHPCEAALMLHCKLVAVQVTPSRKVVGDLAQFMVQNKLTEQTVVERAGNLNFPDRC